jgi:hypothetical protein
MVQVKAAQVKIQLTLDQVTVSEDGAGSSKGLDPLELYESNLFDSIQ